MFKQQNIEKESLQSKKINGLPLRDMTATAVFTALLCILAPMSVPIGPVPISLTNLVIYLSLYILGMKKGTISYLLYMLIGIIGLPVFSGFTGGPAKLLGPTGGYLVGFIFITLMGGFVIERLKEKYILHFAAFVVSTAVCYAFGTVWFVYLMKCTFAYALTVCVFPFIIVDLCKMILAIIFGNIIRKRLVSAKLI